MYTVALRPTALVFWDSDFQDKEDLYFLARHARNSFPIVICTTVEQFETPRIPHEPVFLQTDRVEQLVQALADPAFPLSGCQPDTILVVSSNIDLIIDAGSFGFQCCYVDSPLKLTELREELGLGHITSEF